MEPGPEAPAVCSPVQGSLLPAGSCLHQNRLSSLLDASGSHACWLSVLHSSYLLGLTAALHVLQQECTQGSPMPPG